MYPNQYPAGQYPSPQPYPYPAPQYPAPQYPGYPSAPQPYPGYPDPYPAPQANPNRFVELPAVWQRRFDFYSRFGLPWSTLQARAAFTALSLGERLRLAFNIPAFLFSALYFFVKGMWRKGLVLGVAGFVIGTVIAALGLPDAVVWLWDLAFWTMTATIANYAYFLHATRRSTSWNPFEGFFRR